MCTNKVQCLDGHSLVLAQRRRRPRSLPPLFIACQYQYSQYQYFCCFPITDSQGYTDQGGWKAAVMAAGEALMDAQMGLNKSPNTRGEVLWHRLRHHFAPSEWDGLALIGKTSSAATLRFNAEADTITDPAGDRWRSEQAAGDAGALAALQRSCPDCVATYNGGWDSHKVRFCSSTRHLWASADLTLIQAWVQEVAWDFPDAWKLFRSHRLIWQQLADGGTWLGFKLIERSVGSAPSATGLASEDADEEDVIAPSLVHAAAAKWAADHPKLASSKKGSGAWEQLIPVLQSTRDPKRTLIPGKFFELLQQWQGPESDFESALISRLRVERRLHAQALSEGGYDDFWAWWGGFVGWCRRYFGSLIEGFTGILNRPGPCTQASLSLKAIISGASLTTLGSQTDDHVFGTKRKRQAPSSATLHTAGERSKSSVPGRMHSRRRCLSTGCPPRQ